MTTNTKTVLGLFIAVCVGAMVLFASLHAQREFRSYSSQTDPELRIELASNASVVVGGVSHNVKTAGVYEMRRFRKLPYLSAGTYTHSVKDGIDVYAFKPSEGESWSATVQSDGSLQDRRGIWKIEKTVNGESRSTTDVFNALLNK